MWQCIAKDMKVPWRSAEAWHWYLAPKESTHNPIMMEEPSEAQHDIQYLKSHQHDETPASIQLEENRKRKFDADAPAIFVKKQKVENLEIDQHIVELKIIADHYRKERDWFRGSIIQLGRASQDRPPSPYPRQEISAITSYSSLSSPANQYGTKDEQVVRVAEALPTHSITAANSVHDPTSALNQEEQMLHLRSIIGPAPTFSHQLARPRFFCTYCYEAGKTKVIKTKQDWIRHEENHHKESGLEWRCKTCTAVFDRGVDFKKHMTRTHKEVDLEGGTEIIQHKRLYACGFERCRELNYDYEEFTQHVAIHMGKGHRDWSYNRTIRNLLKHPPLSEPWKALCESIGPPIKVTRKELQWDRTTAGNIRPQLERFDFGDSFPVFLQGLFLAGVSYLYDGRS
jgi:hypothetical protein